MIATAFVASLSNSMCFSARAADLAPILQGGGYYNWSGYYVGGNLGAGVGRMDFTVTMPGLTTSTSDEIRGFVGGGQGGFNWQYGPWVAGIEADLQFSHQRNGVNVTGSRSPTAWTYFSTLRGRVGYAMDEWLFYADRRRRIWRHSDGSDYDLFSAACTAAGPSLWDNLAGGRNLLGSNFSPLWVAGVGVETQIWDRWTGRIEYLYLQSGSISNTFAISGGTLAVTRSVHDNVIRTGLNYHF